MRYYNKERYITIVNELNEAKAKGIRWFKENPQKYNELLNYQGILANHLFWLEREEFLGIIEKFLNNTIEFEQFEDEFSKLWVKTQITSCRGKRNSIIIKMIDPDPQSDSFCFYMIAIYRGFEEIEDEVSTEEELKLFVKRLLIEVKSLYFNSEKSDVNSKENES